MASQKRPAQDDSSESNCSAVIPPNKHPRLQYGGTVTVHVTTGSSAAVNLLLTGAERLFNVYDDVLSRTSSYFRQQIALHPGKRSFELFGVEPELFCIYLDWAHYGVIKAESIESCSAGSSLTRVTAEDSESARSAARTVGTLCKLMLFGYNQLSDDSFSKRILGLLKKQSLEDSANSLMHLGLLEASRIFEIHALLVSGGSPKLTNMLVSWTRSESIRGDLEFWRASIPETFYRALHENLPEVVTIIVGQAGAQQSFKVEKKQIYAHAEYFHTAESLAPHNDKSFHLRDIDPDVFRSYLKYLAEDLKLKNIVSCDYTTRSGVSVPKLRANSITLMHKLCSLWLAADCLKDTGCKKATMRAIIELESADNAMNCNTVMMIGARANSESHLARWLIDLLAANINVGALDNSATSDLPAWLWHRLFVKTRKTLEHAQTDEQRRKQIPSVADLDKYC